MTQAMTTMEDLSPAEPYTPQTTESAERITRTDALPVTGRDLASLPKDQRLSLKKMARFFWEQYVNGLAARRHHAIAWTMVRSFMRGIHYFGFNKAGQWFIIPRKEGEIRAVTPVLRSQVRHILGFLASNPLGVSTIPVAGSSTSLYKSERTRDILTGWIDDADVHSFASRANGLFLLEGMVGFHRYIDAFRKNVFLRALPASEMFPIPYDAKDPSEMHGLMHVSLVTRQWLELQDENYERVMGRPPINRMADRAKSHDLGMRLDLPSVGAGGSGGKLDGALGITVWMRGNEKMPSGEYVFMLGERIYRYSSDLNVPEIVKFLMPKGMEPVEVARYDENPDDWWGSGPAEAMLASQFSMDRQMTHLEKSARSNRAWTFVDSNVVNVADLGDEDSPLVQMNQDRLEPMDKRPVYHFPAQPVSKDVVSSIEMSLRFGDMAVGLRSGIAFGQQEGRTESGPATTFLGQNAMASLVPSMKAMERAWNRTYPEVLNMLHVAWPEEKIIRVAGPGNVGREVKIIRSQMPKSDEVIIRARPILPGGRNALTSILFQLRTMPGEDGTVGTEVSSREFRQSLAEMNLLPPGVDLADRASSRIQTRINLLIGDTVRPSIQPSSSKNHADRLRMENHKLAVGMLKDVILDDAFLMYSPAVRKALLQQLEFHHQFTYGASGHPSQFDDDMDKLESIQLEETLSAMQADLETQEGDYVTTLPEQELLGVE